MRVETTLERASGATVRLIYIADRTVFSDELQCTIFAGVKGPGKKKETFFYPFGDNDLMSIVRPHEIIKARLKINELLGL